MERREGRQRPNAMRILKGNVFSMRVPIPLLLLAVISVAALGMAPDQADAVKKKGRDKVGYLGVSLQELTDEIIEGLDLKVKRGVLVNEVFDNSPADEAGIRDGDVIVVYDGTKVATPKELIKLVRETGIGDEVKLKVLRDEDTKTLAVVIGERPQRFAYELQEEKVVPRKWVSMFHPRVQLGVKIHDLENDDLAEYFDVDEGKGVLVLGVTDDSAAEQAGVKAGDVIIELNDEDINSGDELIDEVQEMEAGDEFDLVVVRHGRKMTLTGEIQESEEHSMFMFKGDRLQEPFKWAQRYHIDEDDLEDMHENLKDVYRFHIDRDDLHDDLEELKEELEDLKEELKDKLKELEEER
jgi:membrane-associated protease RseP (regulator of RpoE activity)